MSTTPPPVPSRVRPTWHFWVAIAVIAILLLANFVPSIYRQVSTRFDSPSSTVRPAEVTDSAKQKAEIRGWIAVELAIYHAHHTQINANRQQYHDAAQMEITHPGAKRGWDILFGIIDGKLKNQSKYIALAESVVKNGPTQGESAPEAVAYAWLKAANKHMALAEKRAKAADPWELGDGILTL